MSGPDPTRPVRVRDVSHVIHDLPRSNEVQMVRLIDSTLICKEAGTLIVVGDAQEAEGAVYPKRVRRLCWELRTARFLDEAGAVVWKQWEASDRVYSFGVGLFTADPVLIERARSSGMTIKEVC